MVDGVEEAVEYDDEEKLRLDLQLARAARRRMGESARLQKERAEEQARLKDRSRFWDVAKQYGHDPNELAAELLATQQQYAQLTPEQRQALEAEQRAQTAEQKLKALADEADQRAQQQADDAVWADFEPKLIAAAEKAQLPNDPQTMDLLARVGLEFANGGVELSPEHVVAEVQNRQAVRTMRYVPSAPVPMLAQAFKQMPVEKLVAVLDASGLYEPLRAAMVARWKNRGQVPVAAPAAAPPAAPRQQQPRDPDSQRYITASEFRARRRG